MRIEHSSHCDCSSQDFHTLLKDLFQIIEAWNCGML